MAIEHGLSGNVGEIVKTIMIIDYGMGNIGSISHALDYLNGSYFISGKAHDLPNADAYILPGVGAFSSAMDNLRERNLVDGLGREVVEKKKPFFGICLGMQLLAKDSEELGFSEGLGWIDGHVVKMDMTKGLHVPHVGWNNVKFKGTPELFKGIDDEAHFFFDHSFHLLCHDEIIAGVHDYGTQQVSAVRKGNIFATQFHPEKSQRSGLKMMRNYLNYIET